MYLLHFIIKKIDFKHYLQIERNKTYCIKLEIEKRIKELIIQD